LSAIVFLFASFERDDGLLAGLQVFQRDRAVRISGLEKPRGLYSAKVWGYHHGGTDDEIIAFYLDDLDDMPVGSIRPRNEDAVPTDDDPSNEQLDTIASRIIIVKPPSETGGEAADDITTTGPSAQSIPVAAEPVDDNRIE
jgi:hypothetical protein